MKTEFRFLTSLLAAGGIVFSLQAQAQSTESLPLEDLQIFSEVFGKIKSEYVDPVDDATLLRNAIKGMLSGLDPHSVFLDPEDFQEIKITTDGKFGGLGIEVTTEDGVIKIVAPIDGTPAYDAGLQTGDLILKIDDVSVRGMDLNDAVEKMRGDPGSHIKLTIDREGEPGLLEIELVRAIIKVTSVRGEIIEPGYAYVRLSSFQSGTAESLRTRVKNLIEENGGQLKGLVLDLRNNPGGILSGAIEVSDMFLGEGNIVTTRGRTSTSDQSFSAKPDDISGDAPLVVLVNGGSASASEIVAGALQDHKRAIIMGTRTFGKGSVQTVIPMNNGGALKLTTARYFTPSDRSIQARGIIPDIVTEQGELKKISGNGSQVSESDLTGHLENDDGSSQQESTATDPTRERLEKDLQLREALNLLKGMSLVKSRSQQAGD
jgi:carboxyl-terminal processing protease